MKYLYALIVVVVFVSFAGCSLGDVASGAGGNYSEDYYTISRTGNNNLSTNLVDTEYDIFLFTAAKSRPVYVGGLIPSSSQIPNYKYIWLSGDSWLNNQSVEIMGTNMNENYYYGIPIEPIDVPFELAGYSDYAVGMNIGSSSSDSKAVKNVLFRVAEPNAREFTVNVYQQASYNHLTEDKDKIINAFDKMQVPITINPIKNDLADLILDIDNQISITYSENPIIAYAYNKVFPNQPNTAQAMLDYYSQNPTGGLLFYVKNYSVIAGDPIEALGITYSVSQNGSAKYPVVTYVFVDKIKSYFSSEWEDKCITGTAIHELGHLWCQDMTDSPAHLKWHNGNNKDRCVILKSFDYDQNGIPNEATKKILNYLGFCEGHIQRGLNVSWKLKQFSPYGMGTQNKVLLQRTNDLFADESMTLSKRINISNDSNLEINIEANKSQIIKGEFIDILVRIKNNSSDTIEINNIKKHLFCYDNSLTVESEQENENAYLEIPPHEEYLTLVNPLKYINYKKEDKTILPDLPWYYWPEGNYEFNISCIVGDNTYLSNKIPIVVLPVPDSLKNAFDDLKVDMSKEMSLAGYEELYEKYKNSYYAKEFGYKLFTTYPYTMGLKNTNENYEFFQNVQSRYKEFILRYPNTDTAKLIVSRLYASRKYGSEQVLKDILKYLENKSDAAIFNKVLKNQQKYNMKEISSYYNK